MFEGVYATVFQVKFMMPRASSAACVALSAVPRSVATSCAIGVPRPRASPVRFTAIASAGSAGIACRNAPKRTVQ